MKNSFQLHETSSLCRESPALSGSSSSLQHCQASWLECRSFGIPVPKAACPLELLWGCSPYQAAVELDKQAGGKSGKFLRQAGFEICLAVGFHWKTQCLFMCCFVRSKTFGKIVFFILQMLSWLEHGVNKAEVARLIPGWTRCSLEVPSNLNSLWNKPSFIKLVSFLTLPDYLFASIFYARYLCLIEYRIQLYEKGGVNMYLQRVLQELRHWDPAPTASTNQIKSKLTGLRPGQTTYLHRCHFHHFSTATISSPWVAVCSRHYQGTLPLDVRGQVTVCVHWAKAINEKLQI